MIHRDIKAANILVNKGVCKLTDFGASIQIFGDIKTERFKSFIGTPNWMAPEVIQQKGHNRFADIWSLGCTVFEMLTGLPPWSEMNEFAAMNMIAKHGKPPKYPDDCSEEIKDFMDWCFKQDPTLRLNTYELQRHKFLEDVKQREKESKIGKLKMANPNKEYYESNTAPQEADDKPRRVTFNDSFEDNQQSGQPVIHKRSSILKNVEEKLQMDNSFQEKRQTSQNNEERQAVKAFPEQRYLIYL